MIDHYGFNIINNEAIKVEKALQNKQYLIAMGLWESTESAVYEVTGYIDFYNVLSKFEEYGTSINGKLSSINIIIQYAHKCWNKFVCC